MAMEPAILGTARLGNFRLGYVPAWLVAERAAVAASIARLRAAHVSILIAGVDARTRVRLSGCTIHDAINDEPNTCTFTVDGTAPLPGQDIRVSINLDTPRLLFNGTIQTVDATYEGQTDQLAWACTAVDDLVRLNRIRPFGTWTNVSATTIAQSLIADFAPGFTAVNVAAGLPPVSIIFDGSDPFTRCLRRLADAIDGYFRVEDLDLYLFLTETTALPDPIDSTPGRFLDSPPIHIQTDDSQVRTRVYGKGAGQTLITDVPAGATRLPFADIAIFNPLGGQVIAGTTPDGAQSEILTYTGVQEGGGGSLVGPGASPTSAPVLSLAAGTGVTLGSHDVAVVFVTAAGKSIAGPVATIVVGVTEPPATAPTVGTPSSGIGPDAGDHYYAITEVTAGGETTPSPVSGVVTTTTVAGPIGAWTIGHGSGTAGGAWAIGDTLYVKAVYITAAGTTLPGPQSASLVAQANVLNPSLAKSLAVITQASGEAAVTGIRVYVNKNGSWVGYYTADLPNTSTLVDLAAPFTAGSPPVTNTALMGVVPLTNLAPASPLGTARNLYGTAAGGVQLKFVAALNTTDTTYSVTTPDSSLGANVPTTNTAVAGQISTSAPLGPTAVTGREFYMSLAGGGARKLALTISDNTTTTGTIAASDATLTAAAAEPTLDTSGLSQPSGQVVAGATSIPVAGLGGDNGFQQEGGAAIVGSGQIVVSYSGITGNLLTGIPSTGAGSITATIPYNSQITAAPALVLSVIDQQTSSNTSRGLRLATGTPTDYLGADLGVNATLLPSTVVRVSVSLRRVGTVTGNVSVGLFDGQFGGLFTGPFFPVTPTWSDPIDASTISTTEQTVTFTFPAPVSLSGPAGGIVLQGTYTRSDTAYIAWHGFEAGAAAQDLEFDGSVTHYAVGVWKFRYQLLAASPVVYPMPKGSPVHIWVQRDDFTAQAALIALDAAQGRTSDGVVEHVLSDMRRVEDSLIPLCDADLERFSRPIVTVTFDARDTKLKSGKPIMFNLASPAIAQTLTLMSVDISEMDISPYGLLPRFHCVASTHADSLESILRRLLTRTD